MSGQQLLSVEITIEALNSINFFKIILLLASNTTSYLKNTIEYLIKIIKNILKPIIHYASVSNTAKLSSFLYGSNASRYKFSL